MSVDLPAPFWPIRQCTWPWSRSGRRRPEHAHSRIVLDQPADLQQRTALRLLIGITSRSAVAPSRVGPAARVDGCSERYLVHGLIVAFSACCADLCHSCAIHRNGAPIWLLRPPPADRRSARDDHRSVRYGAGQRPVPPAPNEAPVVRGNPTARVVCHSGEPRTAEREVTVSAQIRGIIVRNGAPQPIRATTGPRPRYRVPAGHAVQRHRTAPPPIPPSEHRGRVSRGVRGDADERERGEGAAHTPAAPTPDPPEVPAQAGQQSGRHPGSQGSAKRPDQRPRPDSAPATWAMKPQREAALQASPHTATGVSRSR